jgi:hypothetical protein
MTDDRVGLEASSPMPSVHCRRAANSQIPGRHDALRLLSDVLQRRPRNVRSIPSPYVSRTE